MFVCCLRSSEIVLAKARFCRALIAGECSVAIIVVACIGERRCGEGSDCDDEGIKNIHLVYCLSEEYDGR